MRKKLEDEVSALRFQMDHIISKFEMQLREKQIKMDGMEKQAQEAQALKDRELIDAFEKIRALEAEARRLLDLNRNYSHELGILSREKNYRDQ